MSDVRVLVVDDQAPFRGAMAAVVQETDGFVLVGVANSGAAALDAVERLSPDLVLLDVHLPGIDGIEASRHLRSRHEPPVVVLLSTYEEQEVDLADSDAASYVPKAVFGPQRLARPGPPRDRTGRPAKSPLDAMPFSQVPGRCSRVRAGGGASRRGKGRAGCSGTYAETVMSGSRRPAAPAALLRPQRQGR